MATQNQIRANRENAKKSTGPTSDAGKEVARGNALKHGLAAKLLLPPGMEVAAAEERTGHWLASFRPFEAFDVWLVGSVAAESIRIDHCRVHEAVIRERIAGRAADDLCWDDDRRMAVDDLAVKLPKKPEVIVRKLRQTLQGVDWMIERWIGLGNTIDFGGQWNEDQIALALDLLGVPIDLRNGPTMLDVPDDLDASRWYLTLAAREVTRLRELQQNSLIHWDAADREAAMHGVESTPAPALRLVRRYERNCNRRLEWAVEQLRARKREPMHHLPERDRPLSDPRPSYRTEATEQERAEREEHDAKRFQTWSKLADTEVVHDFAMPDQLVADALDEPMSDPIVPPSPKLADALRRPSEPTGNRRARRAAAARARKAR
jgi:hypothetical protein